MSVDPTTTEAWAAGRARAHREVERGVRDIDEMLAAELAKPERKQSPVFVARARHALAQLRAAIAEADRG